MKMTGAQALIKCLEQKGIKQIYGYPGGAVLPIYDALLEADVIKHILVRDEQSAAHAASGESRSTDHIGVCLSTSGPGATNLVTGIATAYMDSIPMVAITGQVATHMIGTDAFQEVDMTGITLPVSKHSYLVTDVTEIPQVIEDAFHIANTGRKGPVVIDIPKDIQAQVFDYVPAKPTNIRGYKPNYKPHPKQVKRVAEKLKEAKRPLILVGGGVILSEAFQELRELIRITNLPVISTLMGLGAIDTTDKNYYGMVGLHGNASANYAITNCDFLINFGARFDDRTTIVTETFAPHAKSIVHVDIDPAEIGKNIDTNIPIVSDIKLFLEKFNHIVTKLQTEEWLDQLNYWKENYPCTYVKNGKVKPQAVLEKLSELTSGDAYITTEVGQHQMWTAQFYRFSRPNSLITSGGLGTMGYGLSAAIGVAMNNDNLVINVAGDGSFQMNFAEIATAVEQNLPIKVLLFNNHSLSLVKQLQYFATNKRYSGIDFVANPDFVKLVLAYPNTEAYRIESNDQIDEVLDKALHNNKFTLIECMVSNEELVYPVASPSKGIIEMTYLNDEVIRFFEQ